MRYSALTDRLQGLGGAKWEIHAAARQMKRAGREVIELTIGEPDVPCPPDLIEAATAAMEAGRTGYSNGHGEPATLAAIAQRYTARRGRAFGPENVMTLPGTQTALYAVLCTLLGPGDEVIVADPMYATYDGLIAATGARAVPVALRPEQGFRLQAADVAAKITPRTRVLFPIPPTTPRVRSGAPMRSPPWARSPLPMTSGSSRMRSMRIWCSTASLLPHRWICQSWRSARLSPPRSPNPTQRPAFARAGASARPSFAPACCPCPKPCCSAVNPSSPT